MVNFYHMVIVRGPPTHPLGCVLEIKILGNVTE